MESLRIIISALTSFLFIFQWYIWSRDIFEIKKSRKIIFSIMKKSILLTIIGLLLTYKIYCKIDFIMLVILSMDVMMLLIRNKNEKIETFNVVAGTYEIGSKIQLKTKLYQANSVMKVKIDGEEKIILFQTSTPKLNKNLKLDCVKHKEIYLCRKYTDLDKKSLKEILKEIFNYYVIIGSVYSLTYTTTCYLKEILATSVIKDFWAVAISYCMFAVGYKMTINGVNIFTKFWNKIFLFYYIIIGITSIFWLFTLG